MKIFIDYLVTSLHSHICILTTYSDINLHISHVSENIDRKYIFFFLKFSIILPCIEQ